jgi:hypothetical protein
MIWGDIPGIISYGEMRDLYVENYPDHSDMDERTY